METLTNLLKSLMSADGVALYVKVGASVLLLLVGGLFSLWKVVNRKKLRREKAEREKERDKQQDVIDNKKTEEQHKTDGQSVRDRLRNK